MKAAFVIPHYPTQTHVFFWREIVALRERGIEVHVLSTSRPVRDELCHAWTQEALASTTFLSPPSFGALLGGLGLALRALPARGPEVWKRLCDTEPKGARGWLRGIAIVAFGAVAGARARRAGATHLHAHSCADAALLADFASAWTGLPYSMTLHGPLEHYREAQSAKWRHAAFGITVTRRLRQQVLDLVPGVDQDRIHVAAMGVDVGHFRRARAWQAPAPGEPWRIVTCGRLHRAKGHRDVVAAIALLRDQGRDCRLTVIGEGPDREEIERRVREFTLESRVTLTGAVDSDRVRAHLEEAHVFALGSHDEAIGVATMEAMAMELPVVVTDVGGVRELVREDVDGLFVPAEDATAMAHALMRLMGDPEKARSMGTAGAQRVRSEFHAGVSAEVLARELRRA